MLIETTLETLQDEYRIGILPNDSQTEAPLSHKQEMSPATPAIEHMTQQLSEVQLDPPLTKKLMESIDYKIGKAVEKAMHFERNKLGKITTEQEQDLLKTIIKKVTADITQQLEESQTVTTRQFIEEPVENKIIEIYLKNLKYLIKHKINNGLKEWKDTCSQLPQPMELENISASQSEQLFESDSDSDDIEIILNPER